MSKTLDQIVNSNTFGVWRDRTNQLVTELETTVQLGGNSTDNASGHVYINGDVISTSNVVVDVIKPFDTTLGANKVTIDSESELNGNSIVDGILTVSNEGSGDTTIGLADNGTATWNIVTNNSNIFKIETADTLTALTLDSTTNQLTLTGLTIDTDVLPSSATFVDGVTANLTGDVKNADGTVVLDVGSDSEAATFNGTANNANYVGSLQNSSGTNQFDSDDIDEGSTNQFFTTARARGAFSNGTGVSITDGSIAIGQDVGTTSDVTFADVTLNEILLAESKPNAGSTVSRIFGNVLGGSVGIVQIEVQGQNAALFGPSSATFYGPTTISDGNQNARLDVYGAIRAEGDITSFYNFSDIKLKENIEPIENALDKVGALNGYTFNYKNKPDTRVAGVIAQELIQVLPEAVYDVVNEETDESSMAVRYDNIIALLIEAVKDLKTEVEELKKSRS